MLDAWDAWGAEIAAYRARLAALTGAPRPDCIAPKTSAGQGLRAVLNTCDRIPRVVATRGEWLRLTPDLLTTDAEFEAAAAAIGDIASE